MVFAVGRSGLCGMANAGEAIDSRFAGLQQRITMGALVLCMVYIVGVMLWASPVSFDKLDHPYIHMALAEKMARGHFSVNLGEVANPSSTFRRAASCRPDRYLT